MSNPFGTERISAEDRRILKLSGRASYVTLERFQEIRRIASLPATGPNLAMVLLARDCVALIDEAWEAAQACAHDVRRAEEDLLWHRMNPFLSLMDQLGRSGLLSMIDK